MPSYTAILFPNPDGSYRVRVPALPSCQAEGATRDQALENTKEAIAVALADAAREGRGLPHEEWSPARTVWVQNPRRGDTVPYVVAIEKREDGAGFHATPALFPGLQEEAPTIDEALSRIGPRLYEHLVGLVAQKRLFPVQDDSNAYVVKVPQA